jgi:hypothetical protein
MHSPLPKWDDPICILLCNNEGNFRQGSKVPGPNGLKKTLLVPRTLDKGPKTKKWQIEAEHSGLKMISSGA